MPLFWNVSFEYERALCWRSCPPCSFLSWFHDESLCRVFWQFSMFAVDITSGSHGISNSSFPSKHSSDKINFFIATWTKVVERPFFLPDDVLGTTKKKCFFISEKFWLCAGFMFYLTCYFTQECVFSTEIWRNIFLSMQNDFQLEITTITERHCLAQSSRKSKAF